MNCFCGLCTDDLTEVTDRATEVVEPTYTLEQIKNWCLQFDKKSGSYPEHQWEGCYLYHYICCRIENKEYIPGHNNQDSWEEEFSNARK